MDSNISHDELINKCQINLLKEYDDMEGKIESLKPLTIYRRF